MEDDFDAASAFLKWRGRYKWGDPRLEGDIAYFDDSQTKSRRMAAAGQAYLESVAGEGAHFSTQFYKSGYSKDYICLADGSYFEPHGRLDSLSRQPFAVQKEWYEKFGLLVKEGGPWDEDGVRVWLDRSVSLDCDLSEDERREDFVLKTLRENEGLPDEEYDALKERLMEWYWETNEEAFNG